MENINKKHYCPVCYKLIPKEAYGMGVYMCCFFMYNLSREGVCNSAKGTIVLGNNPGDFESIFPREVFLNWFLTIKNRKIRSLHTVKGNI